MLCTAALENPANCVCYTVAYAVCSVVVLSLENRKLPSVFFFSPLQYKKYS